MALARRALMDERSPVQGMAAIRCDNYPECQCDGDCEPLVYEPLPWPTVLALAVLSLSSFAIAFGLLGYLAWKALF